MNNEPNIWRDAVADWLAGAVLLLFVGTMLFGCSIICGG